MMANSGDSFLGTGWAFDVHGGGIGLDGDHHVALAREEEKVRQSIWIILSTARGERIGRPDFGCGIHELVFATRSPTTMGDIARAVGDALGRWEPRIEVTRVDAQPHPDDAAGVLVEIEYRLRTSNSRFNLVYPFYLSV